MTAGFITAVPYLVGAVGMIVWGWHSDRTGERKWHAVIAFLFIIAGLGLASTVDDPTIKMLFLCVAGFGFFAVLPIFWTLPTAFLSGAGAAAGIAGPSIRSAISAVISARRLSACCGIIPAATLPV